MMYLHKNKIYRLNNMHFLYQEALYESYESLRKESFKLRCSVIAITSAQRHSTKKFCPRRVGKNL